VLICVLAVAVTPEHGKRVRCTAVADHLMRDIVGFKALCEFGEIRHGHRRVSGAVIDTNLAGDIAVTLALRRTETAVKAGETAQRRA